MTDPLELLYHPVPEPPPPRRRRNGLTLLIVAVLAAAAGAGAVIGLRGGPGQGTAAPAATGPARSAGASPAAPAGTPSSSGAPGSSASAIPVPPAGSPPAAASGKLDAQGVANMVEPGVVDIGAPQAYGQALSEGTGIILTPNGLVLTNNHVIEGATAPTATLVSSGKTYKATIIGYDSADDVALLQLVGASGLKPVSVGNSDRVTVGQSILALGNAEGQGGPPTVAPGQVTALHQTISPADSSTGAKETLHGTIQTSAQIQPGDSGGPLSNAAGQVVGMDVAASQTQEMNGTSTTAGFAIPIDQALQIANRIAAGQHDSTVHIGLPAFMGVTVSDAAAGCPAGSGSGFGGFGGSGGSTSPGAIVCGVFPGTPAARVGLAEGDVITSVNGKGISNANALIVITGAFRPGQSLAIDYVNATGTTQSVTVALIGGPAK